MVTATIQLAGFPEPIKLTRYMNRPNQLVCPDEARVSLDKIKDLIDNIHRLPQLQMLRFWVWLSTRRHESHACMYLDISKKSVFVIGEGEGL